jgi:hypothetical protein
MEDKKLLYGILAVCVVTLVVSGISVYEVNTVAKQLNTQGEQIAALQEAQAPMNMLFGTSGGQWNTPGEQIAALQEAQAPMNVHHDKDRVTLTVAPEQSPLGQNVIADVAEPEVESKEVPAELKKKPMIREHEANDESEAVEMTPDEGINPNDPPENRALLVPADPLRE